MKLNLGCGFDKRDGWLNVDNFAECAPDQLLDIEQTPWDLPTNGFDHVLAKHVLEHVGAQFDGFAAVMRELYRVLTPGGRIQIADVTIQNPVSEEGRRKIDLWTG